MSKGIAAMSFLPQTSIELVNGSADQSVQAVRAFLHKVADLQSKNVAALSAVDVICNGNSSYSNSTWEITSKVAATGTITAATVVADDTVTVNGLVYTAVSGAKADNTEFSVDTGNSAVATDLADSINNDTRVGTITTGVTALAASAVVTVSAVATGIGGNAITLASSDGGTLAVSGALLSGGRDFVGTFQSEVSNLSDDAKGRPALSTRRLIDIDLNVTADPTHLFSVRSALAVLSFIEKLEDKVANTGSGAAGDGTYTNVVLRGNTPYESYTWTVTKSGNDYTVTPTANS